ncbi:MAG: hypothetical protein ACE5IW_05690 [bacterium]
MKNFIRVLFILLLTNTLVFAVPQDSVKVIPLNPVVGAISIYQISFVTSDTLFPHGQIFVTFPENFDLSRVKIANSININGGFKVSVNGNKLVLSRTGLGRSIMPNERVEVKFANIKNPSESDKQFTVEVEFQNKSDQQIQRKEKVRVVLKAKNSKSLR